MFNYGNYVNSFYCNDVNMLQKRRKQSKIVRNCCAATAGVSGAISLLPGNQIRIFTAIIAGVSALFAFNTNNYIKQTDAKIAHLNANA